MFGSSALSSAPFSSLSGVTAFLSGDVAYGSTGTLGVVRSLTLSGVQAGGFVSSPTYTLNLQLAGVSARGVAGDVLAVYWKLIDDSQAVNWQNVPDTQNPGWGLVTASKINNWQNVANAQSGSWSLVLDEQTGAWVLVQAST